MTRVSVNDARPAANETAAGAKPASNTAGGQAGTRGGWCRCRRARSTAAPTTKSAVVPSSARNADWPVLSAFERSTESDPSTTQKECWTPVCLATSTARLSPTAPRTLLWSHTECRSTCACACSSAEARGPRRPLGWRPSIRSHQPRASAAAVSSTFPATWATAKLSSCARNPGSSALTSAGRSDAARASSPMATSVRCSTRVSAPSSSARAAASGSVRDRRATRAARPPARARERAAVFTTQALPVDRADAACRRLEQGSRSPSRARRRAGRSCARRCRARSGGRASRRRCGAARPRRPRRRRPPPRTPAALGRRPRPGGAPARCAVAPGESAARADRCATKRLAREGDGQSTATATTETAEAQAPAGQPVGTSELPGPCSETGRMKASSNATVALASVELTTPAKSTANPTSAIATVAVTVECDASVPRTTSRARPRPRVRAAPECARAACLRSRRAAARRYMPKAAKVASVGLPSTRSPSVANSAGITVALLALRAVSPQVPDRDGRARRRRGSSRPCCRGCARRMHRHRQEGTR